LRLNQLETRTVPALTSFQNGVADFAVGDTEIAAATPAAPNENAPTLTVAGPNAAGGARQALLRFDNLIGTGPGQVPPGATIQNATLTLWALASSSAPTIDVRRMVRDWSPATATWDEFDNGIQPNGVEAYHLSDAFVLFGPTGYQITSQTLRQSVQTWASGQPNNGWVVSAFYSTDSWSFASSNDVDPARRPRLTVEYSVAGVTNPSYAQLAGQPPEPTKLAWFDWSDDLRTRRLQRVPNDRPNTFYFAQNGNDETGHGTSSNPWKSLAKAQEIIDASKGGVRLRFRRGDVWQEITALQVSGDYITVDDYGDPLLAKPRFSRFQPLAANGWSHVGGDLYRYANPPATGWLREAVDGYTTIYYRAASSAEVAARAFSWYYDAAGNDPSSGDQPSLYVNAAVDPFLIYGGLEVCPNDGIGWNVEGDNVRLENLRLEGNGVIPSGQGYGLRVTHNGAYWEFVGVGLEVFYTGYHAIGQIGQYQGNNSVATLVDCRAGLCVNRFGTGGAGSGDITVYVSYADYGGNEYIQYNCEAAYGALPSADWGAVPGLAHGQGFYCHIGTGGFLNLVICQGTKIGGGQNPLKLINQIDSAAPANSLAEARAFIVEDEPGPIASWWQKTGVVVINCVLDRRVPPQLPGTGQSTFVYGSLNVAGWMINCTATVDASLQYSGQYLFLYSGFDRSKMINCHIDIYNAPNTAFLRNPGLDPAVFCPDATLTNSIVSLSAASTTGIGLINHPDHLRHNGYFLTQPSTNPWHVYTNDPGAVTLPARFPAGRSPSPSSPLYNGGDANGLEYDAFRRPRGSRRTIGPLAGADLPAPTAVRAGWGIRSSLLTPGSVLASPLVDRLAVTFPVEPDVHFNSLTLWDEQASVALASMNYDPVTRTATWSTVLPLPTGRYTVELDGRPIASFAVLPGDITGSGTVDATDFGIFRTLFGSLSVQADLDGDGDVDASDFLMFRQYFGTSL